MKRRTYISLSSIAGHSALAGCNNGWMNQPNEQDSVNPEVTPESSPDSTDDRREILGEFSGRTSTVTDSFSTTHMQLRFDINFSGTSGFTAFLIDPNSEQNDRLLIDVPHKSFQGTVVTGESSESGEWALRIETDDMEGTDIDFLGWEITVWTPEVMLLDDE